MQAQAGPRHADDAIRATPRLRPARTVRSTEAMKKAGPSAGSTERREPRQ
ncbi:hypothetical protein OH687_04805 [Burkholderia anthina]|nr:hypothetical protein OH687_04805 [Burkholderia anthina]